MNLRSVDLNLLVVLDALLDEAHVTRAAERLGLSQPAASAALDRCRHVLGDPLLERGRGLMRLTPRAEALREPIRALLAQAEAVLGAAPTPLSEIRQVVRVVMSDYPASVVAAPLCGALAASAPGVDIVILPWRAAAAAVDLLGRGGTDLAVSVFPSLDPTFRSEVLLHETYRVVMRSDHPAAPDFDLDRWLAYPHVLVSGQGDTRSPLDDALARLGRARRVGVVVSSFAMAPPILAGSDMIAMLPSRCAPADESFAVFEPPIPVEGFPLHLAWHARRDRDPAVQHVAAILRTLLRDRPGP